MATRQAIAALLAVQLLFAVWPVAGKHLFPTLGPLPLLAARILGAAAVLALLQPFLVRDPIPVRSRWRMLLLLAVLGVALNQMLFLLGLARTSATHASLAITTIPVFTYAIAVVLGRETLGPRRAAGIGLALLGAGFLVVLDAVREGLDVAAGDLMILANAVFFSTYLVLSKPLNEAYDPLSVTTWTFLFGALFALPIAWATDLGSGLQRLDTAGWGWLSFAILGSSVLTYLLNAVALRQVPASTVAVFIYLQPVGTAILAGFTLGERIGVELVPAAALVFTGIWLVARRRPRALEGVTATE